MKIFIFANYGRYSISRVERMRREYKHFFVYLWRTVSVHFLSKMERARPMKREMGGAAVCFPPASACTL